MDWSRAKNILIVMLLVADLVIGGFYVSSVQENRSERQAKIQSAEYYLESKNITLDCEIPKTSGAVPSVTVGFSGASSEKESCTLEYRGRSLEIAGLSEENVTKVKAGFSRVKLRSVAYALIQAADDLSSAGETSISSVELVLYVDRRGYTETEGEDTALPYWKVTSSGGNSFYYAAFSN